MPNSLQPNPSDATASFFQPDWNSAHGVGVGVPDSRNAVQDFDDIFDAQQADAEQRAGHTVAAPTVSTLTPATGVAAGGTAVTISGNNFIGATGVTFGGTAGTSFSVKGDNTIKVTAPAHASGAVSVVVSTPHGSVTKTTAYTYS